MPGLLTHLSVAFVGYLIVYFFNRKYAFSFPVGQILPDAIKFGVPGLLSCNVNPDKIIPLSLYGFLDGITSNYLTWFYLGCLIFFVTFILYYRDVISKDKFVFWNVWYLIFFVGVVVHLVMDVFIIESSYWI